MTLRFDFMLFSFTTLQFDFMLFRFMTLRFDFMLFSFMTLRFDVMLFSFMTLQFDFMLFSFMTLRFDFMLFSFMMLWFDFMLYSYMTLRFDYMLPDTVAQSDSRPTADKEVAGSISAGSGNIFSWGLIIKYIPRSFSPFCLFNKGCCQFLAKECAKVLFNRSEN